MTLLDQFNTQSRSDLRSGMSVIRVIKLLLAVLLFFFAFEYFKNLAVLMFNFEPVL